MFGIKVVKKQKESRFSQSNEVEDNIDFLGNRIIALYDLLTDKGIITQDEVDKSINKTVSDFIQWKKDGEPSELA